MGRQGQRTTSRRVVPGEVEVRPYLSREGQRCINLIRPSDLGDLARLVIGLWEMDIIDPEEITKILFVGAKMKAKKEAHRKRINDAARLDLWKHVSVIINTVFTCKHPVIEHVLDHGLPRACSTPLPTGRQITCPRCRCEVNIVPCVACTSPDLEDVQLLPSTNGGWRPPENDREMVTPAFATAEEAGSAGKVEVMRRRVECGESPFHPDDPQYRYVAVSVI